MNRNDFKSLFVRCVNEAMQLAQRLSPRPLPEEFEIELHGGGVGGQIVSLEIALEKMFVEEDLFYAIIDVGVKKIVGARCRIFVRITDRPPVTWDKTWNKPPGHGPFDVVQPAGLIFE
jgi:hypothetical protein